ncbi:MAG: hypothetical protein ABI662_07110 [Dermatophilaceae bacterium]
MLAPVLRWGRSRRSLPTFTAAFSEPVATFTSASLTYGGTAAASTGTITGAGPTYAVAGMTRTGTVIPAIAAAKVTDIAGNANTAATVTVVFCSLSVWPCTGTNIKATLTPSISPTSGAWSATTTTLGTTVTLYARSTQTDLSGNTGASPVAGPIAIP